MKKQGRNIAILAAAGLMVAALSGCMATPQTQETEAQTAQKANCAYMEQVNAVFDDMDAALDGFDAAVITGDYQTIRTAGAQALGVMAGLNDLSVPDALAEVHQKYVSGSRQLGQAITDYIAVYGAISGSSKAYSASAANARIAKVQKLYDAGIADLMEADKLALEMK